MNTTSIKEKFLTFPFKKMYSTFLKILPWVVLLFSFLYLCFFINERIDFLIDSDMASEQILAKVLAEEGGNIVTKNWHYPTEVRIFNAQLIMTPLFMIFDSWHTVRVLGSIIMFLCLLASLFYLCFQTRTIKLFPWIGSILLMPISYHYFWFVIYGLYYAPYVIVSFLTIALILNISKSKNFVKSIILSLPLFIISLMSGMNGLRQMMLLNIPLCITSFIIYFVNKHRTIQNNHNNIDLFLICCYSILSTMVSFGGYLFNSRVLSEIINFKSFDEINFVAFSFDQLAKVLSGWLNIFGFKTDTVVFGEYLFPNIASFCLVFLTIISILQILKHSKKYSVEEIIITTFFLVGFVIFTIFYSFTDMQYRDRYNIPILVFSFIIILVWIKSLRWKVLLSNKFFVDMRYVLSFTLIIVLSLSFATNYKQRWKADKNYALRDVEAVLTQNGYTNGYATYWQANVLTELSNGKIDVWCWFSEASDLKNIDTFSEWSQRESHRNEKPQGKIFLLFTTAEDKKFTLAKQLDDNNIIFKSKKYVVYGYESYDKLIQTTNIKHN